MDARELDRTVRAELRSLPKGAADAVARHLVAAARFLDEDPERAHAHAQAARAQAGRIAAVREAAGLAAYRAGQWQVALSELRALKRLSGSEAYAAVMADCERALGRPERALEMAAAPSVRQLDVETRMELLIVAAGARRDLGQDAEAVVTLQVPELQARVRAPWLARLRYAYADALAAVGRMLEARDWFVFAAEVDVHGETDADERLLELDGVVLDDGVRDDVLDEDTMDDGVDDSVDDSAGGSTDDSVVDQDEDTAADSSGADTVSAAGPTELLDEEGAVPREELPPSDTEDRARPAPAEHRPEVS